jgi:hypothetical protein
MKTSITVRYARLHQADVSSTSVDLHTVREVAITEQDFLRNDHILNPQSLLLALSKSTKVLFLEKRVARLEEAT